MTTTSHSGSVRIEAPVEEVFDHVKEPQNFFESMPEQRRPRGGIRAIQMKPEGVGSTYEWIAGHIAGFELVAVMTRDEFVPNERIVDRASTGPSWTWELEPEDEGTKLSLTFEYSTKIPFMDRIIDAIGWRGDADLEAMLAAIKENIEA